MLLAHTSHLTPRTRIAGLSLLQRFFTSLASKWPLILAFFLAIGLCWQLAHWTWQFLTPAPSILPQQHAVPNTDRMADALKQARLFGLATQPAPAEATKLTPLNAKLSGVFASSGEKNAIAIINVERKGDLPFLVGDSVLPEVTLEEVNPDHVILRRGAVLEKLPLEQAGPAISIPGATLTLNVRRDGNGRFNLSRTELDKILSDPAQLAKSGRLRPLPNRGVRIEETGTGSFLNQLGLQKGDIIHLANGKPVKSSADLLQSYRESSQIVVEGTRNRSPFKYNYAVH